MKRSPMNRATPGALAWARKKRSSLARVGKRGKQRKAAWEKAKAEHKQMYRECQFADFAWRHGQKLDILALNHAGPLDVHHVIPRGMGGGKDYGVYATLCRRHHEWVERNREEAREMGLLLRPRDLRGEADDD